MIEENVIKDAYCLDGARAVIEDWGGVEEYNKIQYRLRYPELNGYLALLMRLGDDFNSEQIELNEIYRMLKRLPKYINVNIQYY
jgi:hypothetical protein